MLFSANSGLSCITDLHTIQPHEKAQLLNIMDKQFISYDAKKAHSRYDINTSVLAYANPVNDKFESLELENIKSKLPFNSDFLSKFNLVFIVREINLDHFAEIAERILTADKAKLNSADIRFIQKYVYYARKIKVKIPPKLGEMLRDFAVSLKQQEETSPFSVTENTVSGILRLAKASARMELRDTIEAKDLERVFSIYKKALNFSTNK